MSDKRAKLHRDTAVVWALAATLIGWQLYVAGPDAVTDSGTLIRFGARKPNFHFPQAPWRLMASVFLHGGWLHLAANCFFVVTWGAVVARLLGQVAFLAAFMVCGFWGSLISDIYGPEALALGASGATSGLVALVLVMSLVSGKRKAWNGEDKQWLISSLGVLVLNAAMAITVRAVPGGALDNWAHVGGAGAGVVLGLFAWKTTDTSQRPFWKGVVALALAAAGVVLSRGSTPFG